MEQDAHCTSTKESRHVQGMDDFAQKETPPGLLISPLCGRESIIKPAQVSANQ
jgi:hypothetical protein